MQNKKYYTNKTNTEKKNRKEECILFEKALKPYNTMESKIKKKEKPLI